MAADGGASQAGARQGLHYLQREAEPAPPATVPTNAPAPPAATAVPPLELKPLALPVLRPVQPPQQIQSQQAAAGLIKEPAAKATAQAGGAGNVPVRLQLTEHRRSMGGGNA